LILECGVGHPSARSVQHSSRGLLVEQRRFSDRRALFVDVSPQTAASRSLGRIRADPQRKHRYLLTLTLAGLPEVRCWEFEVRGHFKKDEVVSDDPVALLRQPRAICIDGPP
jgi:hypothetical protein